MFCRGNFYPTRSDPYKQNHQKKQLQVKFQKLHSGNLTWQWKKDNCLFKTMLFRRYLDLPETNKSSSWFQPI